MNQVLDEFEGFCENGLSTVCINSTTFLKAAKQIPRESRDFRFPKLDAVMLRLVMSGIFCRCKVFEKYICDNAFGTRAYSALVATQQQSVGTRRVIQDMKTTTADKVEAVCNIITQNCDAATAARDMESALEKCGVRMSTEVVDLVLAKLRFQEKVALRFFTWAGKQQDYRYTRQTINEMVDILSNTRFKSKQFSMICALLEQKKTVKKGGPLPLEAYIKVIEDHAAKNLKLPKKPLRAGRLRHMKNKAEINSLNTLLDTLCKCNLVLEAQNIFDRIKTRFNPDAKTYTVLFFGWCRIRKSDKAMQIMNDMVDAGFEPDCFTYNSVLSAFCDEGRLEMALKLFDFMRTKGYTRSSPVAKTFQIMIVALVKADRTEEALKMLAEMRDSGCVPDVPTYTEIIEGFCSAGKVEEAYRVLHEMKDRGYPPDILTYNCFLKALCNLRNKEEALNLLDKMKEAGCSPSTHTYIMLIKMFCELGEIEMGFEMWHDMHANGCLPDVFCYIAFIQGLFSNGNVNDARLLLTEVMDKHMKLPYEAFDSFLMELSKSSDLRMIERVSKYMKRFYHPRMARQFSKFQRWRGRGGRRV